MPQHPICKILGPPLSAFPVLACTPPTLRTTHPLALDQRLHEGDGKHRNILCESNLVSLFEEEIASLGCFSAQHTFDLAHVVRTTSHVVNPLVHLFVYLILRLELGYFRQDRLLSGPDMIFQLVSYLQLH